MELRQLPAASARSDWRKFTCTSFSASAKVDGETSGPTGGAVPKAGGVPAGSSPGSCFLLLQAVAAPSRPIDELAKKFLRDFDMYPLKNCNRDLLLPLSFVEFHV
jgi:hypothetical protein